MTLTSSDCSKLLSLVLLYLHMLQIPFALGCRAYLLVWLEELRSILCRVFRFLHRHPSTSLVCQFDRCLSFQGHGGLWLGCQVLPAIGTVSISELAATSGGSSMSQVPYLHLVAQLSNNISSKKNSCSYISYLSWHVLFISNANCCS